MPLLFDKKHPFFHYRFALFIRMFPIVIIGLSSKFYSGPGQEFSKNYLGDFFVEIFLILVVSCITPQASSVRVALQVFTLSSLIEFLQLWHPPFLQAIRATLLGRLILGSTFSWDDFLYYIAGCTLGWIWLRSIKQKVRAIAPIVSN